MAEPPTFNLQAGLDQPATIRPPRLHGLDALRGLAAVLVVMLHAGTPYALAPMPGLLWPVGNTATSPLVDALFWGIEGFIMPLFFVLAGFVAVGLHDSLGSSRFVRHRARRLLVPLLFGAVAILPFDLYVWAFGCAVDGRCTLRHIQRMKYPAEIEQTLWGTGHLWFLLYLFLYSAALAGGSWLWRTSCRTNDASRREAIPLRRRVAVPSLRPVLFVLGIAVPAALVVYWEPMVVYGFQHAVAPVPSKLLYNAVFFAAGVLLSATELRDRIGWRPGVGAIAAAIALFVGLLPLIHQHLAIELTGTSRATLAAGTGLFATLMSLGLVAAGLAWTRPIPVWLRRLNEASFWIYLAHHPVVGLAHIALAKTAFSPGVRFLLATAAALAFSLLTWHVAVRNTWIGLVLHGRRSASSAAPQAAPPEAPARAA